MSEHPIQIPGWPRAQGLFEPALEKDACGVGFVCHMKGERSHQIIKDALTIDLALSHRGACGCEPETGDGAGMFLQIPDKFFRKVCGQIGFELPPEGQYGAGILSFPKDAEQRTAMEKVFEEVVAEEGQEFLGWRDVPVNSDVLGATSASCEPFMRQAFIKRGPGLEDPWDFERKLYVIRRVAKRRIQGGEMPGYDYFYIATLSARTMVYKGMLTPEQLDTYFPDFHDPDMESALALVHSRFSTNTFPSWPRAHPYRYMSHNGEINTLRGNVNWMKARQACIASEAFGDDYEKILPICREDGSDSAMFDNTLEFLTLAGRDLPHAVMMMIPEPWENHEDMKDDRRAFYEYHAMLMEPWDGPASIAFTDGTCIGAVLDRNGLRPSRYYVTSDHRVIMASEVGVLPEVDPSTVIKKGRLEPGRMFLVNMQEGRIVGDEELKQRYIDEHPYGEWLEKQRLLIDNLPEPTGVHGVDHETVLHRQKAFGYTYEDLRFLLAPMAQNGVEPVGSMGNDAPLAVLSNKPKLLYNYFKQLFAQVTNPPLDSIREAIITASVTYLGSEGDLTNPRPESCRMLKLDSPMLDNRQLAQIRQIKHDGLKAATLDIIYDANGGGDALEQTLEELFQKADELVKSGVNILILSDRSIDHDKAGIPALLATAALHHHLIRAGLRTRVSLVLESGEPREVHHFAVLIGYGADAINPYLAFESLYDLVHEGVLKDPYEECVKKYIKAAVKGIIKTMSKMGISTVASYRGAQIFEAIGLKQSLVDKYFTWTATRVEGIGLDAIAEEVRLRHRHAFPERDVESPALDAGGVYQWRHDGEYHLWNPQTVHTLQAATRTDNYDLFQTYTKLINEQTRNMATLRGLFEFEATPNDAIPIEEVEPIENIMKRFKTGAMSYGSISKEAHESLAIAMNRVGGKSNTGEGGEDPDRYTPDANGDSRCSAIKQAASGRFGVTSNYLVNSKEIQIKIAQGAKPGEGGQLPGLKVFPEIAKVRGTTAGVGLISPPPHHDIYSIEDLSQLIHDLKNANHHARINVKLVAEIGVGTIAAGVAKGHADVILISGYDGGTGASPLSSIQHAGAPWELGLAETNQILLLNNLRSRVVLEADGQMKTGRDIVIAALLGAEEFGMSTAPLVTLGCLMMRVCHKNTCPVGVATQNPELRKKFMGDPEYVVRFMKFIAQEIREYMAMLGFRSINEMVGRVDKLKTRTAVEHWKAKGLDFSKIFYRPPVGDDVGTYCQLQQDHGLDKALDNTHLLNACKATLENKNAKSFGEFPIVNTNRVVGTILGSEITRRHGFNVLEEDTITLKFKGSAGQSFAAFCPKGMTMILEGDSNDYCGKGLSGAKVVVFPPKNSHPDFVPEKNIIVGNVCFYGATGGEAYIAGVAGERFCVRNSGVHAVIEGVGDHGCEYMTGGSVTILGHTGRNFAAGMSGGIAYILDENDVFEGKLNREMVSLIKLIECDDEEISEVKARIQRHVEYTGSARGQYVLDNWDSLLPKFQKVLPRDYERMLQYMKQAREDGLSGDDAVQAAFEANAADVSRVSGN